MSIKKPTPNLGPRVDKTRTKVADTFHTPSATQTKLTHRIDDTLHRRFKRLAVEQGRPMGEIVVELIDAYVKAHER